jgi:GTPase SAR1 family protein
VLYTRITEQTQFSTLQSTFNYILFTHSEINLKMVLLGNSAVGKTSLLHKLTTSKFEDSYTSTIGVDYV